MDPRNPEQLAVLTDTSLAETKKIDRLLKLVELATGDNREVLLMGLIERVKSVATPMKEATADDEEHEVHPTHESKANFSTSRLPIMKVGDDQLELNFFIFAPPEGSPYKPSINAQWFLKTESGETRLLQEYASAKTGPKDQLATLGLITQSVELYEAACQNNQAQEGYHRIVGLSEPDSQI